MSIFVPVRRVTSPLLQSIHSWFARKLEDQKPKGSIATLDGVRALAFLIVLVLHIRLMTSQLHLWDPKTKPLFDAFTRSGFSGVTLFFVLSGFLLFLPYANTFLLNKPWPQAKIFYLRRCLRIFPAYFLALFLLVMLQHPSLLTPKNWPELLPFLTFTMGFGASQPIDGPLWTLAIEFQYYLLLPLIALAIYGLTRLVRPERRIWIVLGCLFALIAWGLALVYIASHPGVTFLISRHSLNKILAVIYSEKGKFLEEFAVGMLVAVLYVYVTRASNEKYLRIMQRLSPWIGVLAGLLFSFATMRYYSTGYNYLWPVVPRFFQLYRHTEFDFAVSYGLLLIAVLFNRPGGLLRRLFEWDPLRWLGLITFSLYIWHIPLLHAIQNNMGASLFRMNHLVAFCLCWILVLGVCLPFCFVLYVLVEKPFMRLSEKWRQQILMRHRRIQDALSSRNPLSPGNDSKQDIQIRDHVRSDKISHVGATVE